MKRDEPTTGTRGMERGAEPLLIKMNRGIYPARSQRFVRALSPYDSVVSRLLIRWSQSATESCAAH
jgi:hypothetical protein